MSTRRKFLRTTQGLVLIAATFFAVTPKPAHAGELAAPVSAFSPKIFPASDEGLNAIKKFTIAEGLKMDLFAAEPMLANPVAISIDEKGSVYVAETFRLHAGVTDIRGHMTWLDDELASTSTEDFKNIFSKYMGSKVTDLTKNSERVQMLMDTDGDGKADRSTIFAEGFNSMVDGIAAGVLARKGQVYLANIPHLWSLRDRNGDGVADEKTSLHYGYGVRVGFLGHDLHGLRIGPDGKLYFSIGDRGFNVTTGNRNVSGPEMGAVFRCNLDGSELEIFAIGLRNPQELAFDAHGNLFTGDNNSDGGDQARFVYLVEGGDSGWRVGWQFIERPNSRGPWNYEKMWYPQWDGQPAHIVPPIANVGAGPSGLAFYPGVGLPGKYQNHFLMADFRGSAANSVIHSFALKQNGATFALVDRTDFVRGMCVTDVDFGPDSRVYISDWVDGWGMPGKGRIYRVSDDGAVASEAAREVRTLLAAGLETRSPNELMRLLSHIDQRVRTEAQFALAARGVSSVPLFGEVLRTSPNLLARLHAVWGLGQIGRERRAFSVVEQIFAALRNNSAEVRAQAAKVAGELRMTGTSDMLTRLVEDPEPRVRFNAVMSLGKLRAVSSMEAVFEMLRSNADKDAYLRHAGVMALTWWADDAILDRAANHSSPSVRLAALLAMRRLERPQVAQFINDREERLVIEAARAINDAGIVPAMGELAEAINHTSNSEFLHRRTINANFRSGQSYNAGLLARFAARTNASEVLRVEAISALGDWAKPSGRDRVVNLWRPLGQRDGAVAANALRSVIEPLLNDRNAAVQVAAVRATDKLKIAEAGNALFALVSDKQAPPAARTEALRALAGLNDNKLSQAVAIAAKDESETLRNEATKLQAKLRPGDASGNLVQLIDKGTIGEQQNALATLATVEGEQAEKALNDWTDKLIAGQVKPELQLDVIEAASKRNSATLKAKLEKFQQSRKREDISGFRETLAGGNAANGKKIFFERAEASCLRCHKVGADGGGEVGPELTKIGSLKTREYLLESIVFPNNHIAEGFENVIVTQKDGIAYAGQVRKETETELTLLSPEDGEVKIAKANIEKRERGLSGMPDGMGDVLSPRDLRDLVEYLANLK